MKTNKTYILDPYTLLLIFYHIDDIKTLYGSCSIVCRDWYQTFFAVEISEKKIKWKKRLQPLHHSSFCKLFDKIVFLNGMVKHLKLSDEYNEWMGISIDHDYSLYSQLEQELYSDGKIIGNLLKQKQINVIKPLFKKRYMTLGCFCPLVASVRNPHMAIRKLSQANEIPFEFQQSISSCCQFLIAVVDLHTYHSTISFYSTIDNQCLLKEFKIIGENVKISSLVLSFHPLKNAEHRKILEIDNKNSDVNIYCLYVLFSTNSSIKLKKFLVCDQLEGDLIIKEHCEMLNDTTGYTGYHYLGANSLGVPGWQHIGLDLVVILTPSVLFIVYGECGVIHYISTSNNGMNSLITPYSGDLIHYQASYIMNYTKSLNSHGFTLVDLNKYTNYSVFTLQFGGRKSDLTDFIYAYLVIAQSKDELEQFDFNKYSIICKLSSDSSKSKEFSPEFYHHSANYNERIVKFKEFGKKLDLKVSYQALNEKLGIPNPETNLELYDKYKEKVCEINLWEYDPNIYGFIQFNN